MRNFIAYTAARLLLFAIAFGVVYLLGARGLLAAVLALLISGLVSFVLLSRQRDAMSASLVRGMGRLRGMGERLDAGAAKEDHLQQTRSGAAPSGETERDGSEPRA
ncbi:DUF4229 domain-containing protein [Thermobifida halotolerans]|uniref:DUF4229 domain-containing protein n=1 Tax=Thermobifida halotolerans TaxID=483545 RepID=A0A399FZ99_9ACTN|nr:DUF4229 domain-containing protein [Thermobifida halotolerans]UOE18424.1 DUF4229 domain-containing protein [Thermobifida halotolerans]